MSVDVFVAADPEHAAVRAARLLAEAAHAREHLVLAGGSTPRRAYELAAELNGDWSAAQIWCGDERCVPPDDARSNFRLVEESLLSRLARPPAAVHAIPVELGAEQTAAAYDRELREVRLGLVLLGIGPDGHTASLFPDSPALGESSRRVVAAEPGLEPRVPSRSRPRRSHPPRTSSSSQSARPSRTRCGAPWQAAPSTATPASLIRSRRGTTTAIVDRDAAPWL